MHKQRVALKIGNCRGKEGGCGAHPAVLCTAHHLNLLAGVSCSAACVAHSRNELTVQPVRYSITDNLSSTVDDTTRIGVNKKQ
jgi:hypothetical protein